MNDVTLALLIGLFTLGAVMWLLPSLTPRRYFFGLTVAPEFWDSETGRAIRHGYHVAVTLALAVSAALLVALSLAFPQAAMPVAFLPFAAAAVAAFFYARHRVARYSTTPAPVREAEVGREPESLPRWTLLALPPFAILFGVGAYLQAHWDEIPARFPVHWGVDEQPDRWVERTPHGVYGPLLLGGLMMAFLFGIALSAFYGSRRSAMRVAMLKIILAATYLLAIVFGMVGLLPLHLFPPLALVIPAPLLAIAVVAYSLKISSDPSFPVDQTPDSCWWLSSIYYNPADPALFVQKRIGAGYTLNFGNRMSWALLAVTLAIIPAAIFLLR